MPWTKTFNIDDTLDKAMRRFWSHGYEATSLQTLMQDMEINPGSLYDTFGDKRRLFIAALRRYDDQCRKARLQALEQKQEPKAALAALFQGWIDDILADPAHRGCFLTNTALELAAHDREIGAIVAASQQDTERFFCRLIEQGQTSGEISADVDAPQTACALLAALLGLLVLARSRPEQTLLQSIAASALATLESGSE